MKYSDRMFKNGYLYIRGDVVLDVISGKYKMTVKKIWREFYARKKVEDHAFSYGYSNLHIFISSNVPFLKTEAPIDYLGQFEKIKDNWEIVLEYALDKINIELIELFESDRYSCDTGSITQIAIKELGITAREYMSLEQVSPYS